MVLELLTSLVITLQELREDRGGGRIQLVLELLTSLVIAMQELRKKGRGGSR